MNIDPRLERRLQTEHNIWLATTRPDGRPQLVPIWFVWQADKAYLCTGAGSVKARNVAANPQVELALEAADSPVVIEGRACPVKPVRAEVIEAFRHKFNWDISTDDDYDWVIEIVPGRIRA